MHATCPATLIFLYLLPLCLVQSINYETPPYASTVSVTITVMVSLSCRNQDFVIRGSSLGFQSSFLTFGLCCNAFCCQEVGVRCGGEGSCKQFVPSVLRAETCTRVYPKVSGLSR
jgi:hypothetical protein